MFYDEIVKEAYEEIMGFSKEAFVSTQSEEELRAKAELNNPTSAVVNAVRRSRGKEPISLKAPKLRTRIS